MKRLTQALIGLLFACGVCVGAQVESPCHGDLLQSPSVREVVVWVNENGEPIDMGNERVQTSALTSQMNPAPNLPLQQPPVSTLHTDGSRVASSAAISKKDADVKDGPVSAKETHKELPQQANVHPKPPVLHLPLSPPPPPPPHSHHHPHPHPHPHPVGHFGISYSPYKADRTCKNQEEVNQDLAKLSDYSFVRIYGTDCHQAKTVTNAARRHNMRVFGGVYDLKGFPESLNALGEAVAGPDGKKDWSIYHTIAVGNELVNSGTNSPGDVASAVQKARSVLRAQGYKGPVVTVDTFSVLIDHPELCHVSDYCAANCHAFFDATQHAGGAGAYVLEQARAVSAAAGGKRTMITESGWPHAGEPNGVAIPSFDNQKAAIASLRKNFDHRRGDLVLFTSSDDLWKDDNQFTFSAEKFWGIDGL